MTEPAMLASVFQAARRRSDTAGFGDPNEGDHDSEPVRAPHDYSENSLSIS